MTPPAVPGGREARTKKVKNIPVLLTRKEAFEVIDAIDNWESMFRHIISTPEFSSRLAGRSKNKAWNDGWRLMKLREKIAGQL